MIELAANALVVFVLVRQLRSFNQYEAISNMLKAHDRDERRRDDDRAIAARRKARATVEAAGGPCSNGWWQSRAMDAVARRNWSDHRSYPTWTWGDERDHMALDDF